jgi:endonuclease G
MNYFKRILLITLLILSFANYVTALPIEECDHIAVIGLPSTDGELLCRKGYLVSYNKDRKNPNWVMERLTVDHFEGQRLKRKDSFQADPDLKEGERAELYDYKGSGFDRGHMAPSANMAWDRVAMEESFYLSNMVPQVGVGMNQGIWKVLEESIRNVIKDRRELFVITGPVYFNEVPTIGPNKVAVPSILYKIIYDPYREEVEAFVMPNKAINEEEINYYLVPVTKIEFLTGYKFFNALEEDKQKLLKDQQPELMW